MEKMKMSTKRILCYSPYTAWHLHGVQEMTIIHGLRLRGAEVNYLFCDALYSDCDMHWKSARPRNALSCLQCQAKATKLAAELAMPYNWLGRYITIEEFQEAKRWAQSVPPEEMTTATYRSWEIGDWVKSSIHTHVRNYQLDLTDPEVIQGYRSYLYSGLVAAFGLNRALEVHRPEVVFLFSGRFSSLQVFYRLAQQRGIRIVSHERGWIKEAIWLTEGPRHSLKPYPKLWEDWGAVPLTEEELRTILNFWQERRYGRNQAWHTFSPVPSANGEAEVCRQLGLNPQRPLWVMFPNTDDETANQPEYNHPFGIQDRWIFATLDYLKRHPEIDLVIRVHPNTKDKNLGINQRQYRLFQQLKNSLPTNVKIVMPEDDISSYTLMDLATLGLVFYSTAGLEMACLGRKVIASTSGWYAGMPFVQTVTRVEEYERILDTNLNLPWRAVSKTIQRLALRFAYSFLFRYNIKFPLVQMPKFHLGQPTYTTLADLLPGRDASLDRVCRIILDGEPVLPPPNLSERYRSDEDERRILMIAEQDWETGHFQNPVIKTIEELECL